MTLYICFLAAVFGACIGSFINVVVYRLPSGTFLTGKYSCCPDCGKRIRPRDLLPVLSWLFLKGRCRHCKADISPLYPMIEAFCSLIAVLCVLRFGAQPYALLAFGVLVILIAVALIDYVTMEIPDSLSVVIALLAVAAIWLHDDVALSSRAIGLFAVSLPMLLLALVINGAFGGGDIKLMAAAGLFLGWQCVLLAFFIAALFGGGYSIFLLFSGRAKRGTRIAFGPYLCLGLAVSVFYGARIIEWYVSLLRF